MPKFSGSASLEGGYSSTRGADFNASAEICTTTNSGTTACVNASTEGGGTFGVSVSIPFG